MTSYAYKPAASSSYKPSSSLSSLGVKTSTQPNSYISSYVSRGKSSASIAANRNNPYRPATARAAAESSQSALTLTVAVSRCCNCPSVVHRHRPIYPFQQKRDSENDWGKYKRNSAVDMTNAGCGGGSQARPATARTGQFYRETDHGVGFKKGYGWVEGPFVDVVRACP